MICFKIKHKKLVYILDADSVRQSWKFLFKWLKSENYKRKQDKKNLWSEESAEKDHTRKITHQKTHSDSSSRQEQVKEWCNSKKNDNDNSR